MYDEDKVINLIKTTLNLSKEKNLWLVYDDEIIDIYNDDYLTNYALDQLQELDDNDYNKNILNESTLKDNINNCIIILKLRGFKIIKLK